MNEQERQARITYALKTLRPRERASLALETAKEKRLMILEAAPEQTAPRQWRFWPLGAPRFAEPAPRSIPIQFGTWAENKSVILISLIGAIVIFIFVINKQSWTAQVYGLMLWVTFISALFAYVIGKGIGRLTPYLEQRWTGSWLMMTLSSGGGVAVLYLLRFIPPQYELAVVTGFITAIFLINCAMCYAWQTVYIVWRGAPSATSA